MTIGRFNALPLTPLQLEVRSLRDEEFESPSDEKESEETSDDSDTIRTLEEMWVNQPPQLPKPYRNTPPPGSLFNRKA
jgi:hypothetical protein